MAWQLWLDYHRTGGEGLTHGKVRNAVPGTRLAIGEHVVVGNEEADPAVVEICKSTPAAWS